MEDLLENKVSMVNKDVTLDKEYIKYLLQQVLDKANAPDKRRIIEHNGEFNFSCPICGDSHRIASKKRGHVYFNSMFFKCYNEDTCSRSFTKLLKTFNVDMDLDKKLQLYNYLDSNITYHQVEDVQFDNLDKLFDIQDLTNFYSDKKYRHITKLKPLQSGSIVDTYVRNIRKIGRTEDIYQCEFWITDKWMQPCMVYINKVKNKVVSLQVRNLLDGDKRMFKIYDFSKVFFEIYPEGELDDQEKMSYDKLSHFFNIFRINWTKPVNIFEGYIDSLFLPNSIGMVGVNTDLSFLLKEDGLMINFIFDNDRAGFKKSREMINKKYTIFLWNKFFIDIIKGYKGTMTKDELIETLNDIKDFNALQLKFRKKPIFERFDFEKYFSNDDLDIYYLEDLKELAKML